jgi:CubicO group peptidase (beta-lactamase class C family)
LTGAGRIARGAGQGPGPFARADELIEKAIEDSKLPGAVLLVGQGNKILYRKAYGSRAVQPKRVPMTVDTVFDLASLSKPVGCATSIMILAERGKLRVTDPVAKYLPAFAANGKQSITVEQLLLHRGGLIPDNPLPDYDKGSRRSGRRGRGSRTRTWGTSSLAKWCARSTGGRWTGSRAKKSSSRWG